MNSTEWKEKLSSIKDSFSISAIKTNAESFCFEISNFLKSKFRITKVVLAYLFVVFLTQISLFAFSSADKARVLLRNQDFAKATIEYSHIASGSRNPALVAEYSYALILAGQYDLALSQLDRAFIMNADNADVLFFGSKILDSFGFKEVASELEQ